MTEQSGEMTRPVACGVRYERHPTIPNLVAVCTQPEDHDGDHSNALPKTLPSTLRSPYPPGLSSE